MIEDGILDMDTLIKMKGVDKPINYVVGENKRTGLPYLKKK